MTARFILIMIVVLMAACEKPPSPANPPRPALVMIVGKTDTSSAMILVGEVRPRYESAQGFRISGKIIERKVDVGAMVKKNQVLARLDAADSNLNVAAAMADVRAAEASHALALAELDRQRQLFEKKFISASALDIREAELRTSSARLAQVKARANVSGNQAQYANLVADRDGVITMIRAEPGQVVQAGDAIVQIANLKETEVLVAVPESRMGDVRINAPVSIKMWATPQKMYKGVVREISPVAESETRAFNVRVSIKDADELIKLGMTAGVRFDQQMAQPLASFLIPSSALTEVNGKKTVWVIGNDDKAERREVVAGDFTEHGVLITGGLQIGERIATAGVHTLVHGQQVKPVVEILP
jgi:RND family efflux transporter MFP subunit